ncbi:MAG: bestrophin family ion channel [Flavobacteriales bacterium]|nr:bestrophin family ion channel [Flavobacteriales bacterium]
MYVGKDFQFAMLWHFARKNLIITFIISAFAVVLYKVLNFTFIAIPFLPVGTIGTAVAFYIGFKNNNAYDRLWEGRRLWGGVTNTSRSLAAMIIACTDDKEIRKDILYRHLAYINVLRLQLRRTIPWATSKENLHQIFKTEHHELQEYNEGVRQIFKHYDKMQYHENMKDKSNIASLILKHQYVVIGKLKKDRVIDDFEHSDILKYFNELYNLQGGCERIKTTPLFRQYSVFSRVFVKLFIALLPFALLNELNKIGEHGAWLTIPFSLLISWVFFTMEQIGEFSENPFDSSVNDTPMSTICRNIEIDIKELLGETEIPEKLQPIDDVLL